jgi:hypothetical protein
LSRHNPILYRVFHSFPLAKFKMCPDFRAEARIQKPGARILYVKLLR